ncbi:MAG: phage tail tape measure protein [Paracoccaceae bacterium]
MDKTGRKMQQFGKSMSMKVTAPIVALGAVSFNVFKSFEQEMSKVQAVSGATAEEFKALSDNAKQLGASTMFSAREVASLQTEFAKLGFSATEITKVTESTLALAQASGSDLARAAEVAGSTLRAFGLDASETGRVTDVMAASFSSSALDMETFAESMKFVAPVAKSAGMSIEETSAMLQIMSNAGIKGSQAGTALRRIISEIGASGKPTAEALKDLAAQGLNLADAKDEVGRHAQSALLVLAEGVDQIKPLTTELEHSGGAAQKMADIMGNTAFGAGKRLESAMEGLAISVGELVAVAVVPLVEFLAKAAGALNNMSDGAKKAIVIIGGIAAAIGPAVFILGSFQRALVAVRTATWLTTAATTAFGVAVQIATSPITLIIAAIAALSAGVIYVAYNFKAFSATAKNAIASMVNAVIPAVNLLINSFNRAAEFFGMESIMIEPFQKMEKTAVPAFKSLGQVVTEIKDDLGLLEEQTEETTEETTQLATSMDIVAASTDKAAGATKRMTESLMELAAKPIQILKPQLAPTFQTMQQGFVNTTALAIRAGNAIKDVFAQSLREAFGELEKGETRFGKFKESMGRMLRDMIIQFLAAATAAFALAVAVRFALGGAAGIGGIADIFGTMQSVGGFMPNIPMLAEGGIVTGPTLAMIGEGAQSEAVIPLDRLHEFGGGGKVEVVGRISGADILLSNERAQRNRTRQRGF